MSNVATTSQLSAQEVERIAQLVQDSFGRCCLSKTFFSDFYDAFLHSSPAIAPKFAKTDMEKQQGLLRNGLSYTIMFFKGSAMATQVVGNLSKSHSRSQLDIAPPLYDFWLNSLIATIKKHDKEFSPALEQAWRTAMNKTISTMRGGY